MYLGVEVQFWGRMGKAMQQVDFFTNMSLMLSCNTPEFFNARLEVVQGRLYIFTKKKFLLILQLHCVPLVPQIYQKILLSDPRWRTWFFEPRPFLP